MTEETFKANDINKVKDRNGIDVTSLTYTAICAALMAVCSWISIPMPWGVAYTLQTFAVFFAVALLGGKKGTISVLVWLLLGAVGLPVFSGFKGGLGALLGTTGGYIIGFIFMALFLWAFEKLWKKNYILTFSFFLAGLLICYAFGTVWFMVVYSKAKGAVSLGTTLSWCVLPYIIPDVVKILLAVFLSKRIGKVFKTIK